MITFQVWLLCCTFFVFLALMEYFIVLFGIRYDKHWRQQKKIHTHLVAQAQQVHLPSQPSPSQNLSVQSNQTLPSVETVQTPVRIQQHNTAVASQKASIPLTEYNAHFLLSFIFVFEF